MGIAVGVAASAGLGIGALICKYCGDFLDCMPTVFTGGDSKRPEEGGGNEDEGDEGDQSPGVDAEVGSDEEVVA